ncbi:MAG: ester cyclase [Microbacterium sp.]
MSLDPVAYLPYKDPDDFIREVTDLIWVDRSISYIRENYEPDSIVHGALGTSTTRQEVIEGSLMRISATPDRTGQAEDVIWEARGDDAFLSSHLVLSGDLHSPYVSRTIANCLYRRDRTIIRPEGYRRALLRLLESFPGGQFEIRDIQTNYDVRYAGLRVAVVWKFVGDYNGVPNYGPLTGKPIDLIGISQFTFHNGAIVKEVRLWDDIALRAQIAGSRGDEPVPFANIY